MRQVKAGTEEDEAIRRLVFEIAKALVDESEAVSVEILLEDFSITMILRVASSDIGKIIGKRGLIIQSIRTVLHGASMKLNKRYSLNVCEEDKQDSQAMLSQG